MPSVQAQPGETGLSAHCLAKPVALCLFPIPDLSFLPLAQDSAVTALIITQQILKEHPAFVEDYACLTSETKETTHLKMVKGVHFMGCVFYHNLKNLKKQWQRELLTH